MNGNKVRFYRNSIERMKGHRDQIKRDLKKSRSLESCLLEKRDDLEQAQIIIKVVAKIIQKNLEYKISELVSLAMLAIFDEPYEMHLKFEPKRGKTEAGIIFTKNGKEITPIIDSTGGGVVDVASFALRTSLWSLAKPRSRNTIILDEPFKHLSDKYIEKASEMVKMISNKLQLQIIMITHNNKLIGSADRVFNNKIIKGVSICEMEKKQKK